MKSAVLVIDVQELFFTKTPLPWNAGGVATCIKGLTERAREAGVPVIFVQHEAATLPAETPGWEIYSGLTVRGSDPRVRKTTPDSFKGTTLKEELDALGIEHLILCGYATEFCVDTTTRRAAGLGYAVTLAADAHTTHDKAHADGQSINTHHNATLPAIQSFGVPIRAVASADIVF